MKPPCYPKHNRACELSVAKDKKNNSLRKENSSKDSSTNPNATNSISRRLFIHLAGIGAVALGLQQIGYSGGKKSEQQSTMNPPIQGFERTSINSIITI
jgi:hypothetical protein